jgi:hypothetical protein
MDRTDQLINSFIDELNAQGYVPEWEFGLGGDDYQQLYALPYTQWQKENWGKGAYFQHDPDRYLTSQGLYTGQFPDAIPITEDEARTDPRFAKDYDVWQRHLNNFQTRNDEFSGFVGNVFGNIFTPAAALALGAMGTSLLGGLTAPAAGAGAGAAAAETGVLGGSTAFGAPAAAGGAGTGGAIGGGAALGGAGAGGGVLGGGAGLGAGVGGSVAGSGGVGLGVLGGGAGLGTGTAATGLGGLLGSIAPYAPLIATGLSGLTSLIGGAMGADAAKDASRDQINAAREANVLLAALYDQQRQDMAPYRDAGYTALGRLGELVKSPVGYQRYTAPSPLAVTVRPPWAS